MHQSITHMTLTKCTLLVMNTMHDHLPSTNLLRIMTPYNSDPSRGWRDVSRHSLDLYELERVGKERGAQAPLSVPLAVVAGIFSLSCVPYLHNFTRRHATAVTVATAPTHRLRNAFADHQTTIR